MERKEIGKYIVADPAYQWVIEREAVTALPS